MTETYSTYTLFTQDNSILRLPVHDYASTPSDVIWQDYMEQLQKWEEAKEETKYIYDTLALQMYLGSLPQPPFVNNDELNTWSIPMKKVQEAFICFQQTINLFSNPDSRYNLII